MAHTCKTVTQQPDGGWKEHLGPLGHGQRDFPDAPKAAPARKAPSPKRVESDRPARKA